MFNKYFNWPMLAATLIGLCTTLLTYVTLEQYNLDRVNAATASRAEQLASLAQERFGLYEYGLLGARGAILVGGAEAISRPKFEQYINSRSTSREFPGALGFGFVRRVPVADENAFVQRARADGMPDFAIRTLTPHNEERFVIEYIYPVAPNKQAIGLDIGSETNRRTAAIEAALTGNTQLTAPITLVQAEGAVRHGFLILLPVYNPDAILITPADRLKAVIGWSYAPLVVADVLTGFEQTLREVNLSITDMADHLTFFEHQGAHSSATYSDVTAEKHISFMGRQWKFTTSPTAELINELNLKSTSHIAIAGIGLTVAVVFLLFATFSLKQKDDQNDDFSQEISVKTFLTSMAFKKTIFAYCIISACFIIFSSLYFVKDKFTDKAVTLNEHAEYTYNTLASTQQNYIKDLMFLKATPPILNIVSKSDDATISEEFRQTEDYVRFAEIAQAYMLASRDVFQVRLIHHTGKELVRAERKGNSVLHVPETQLQNKADRPYFVETLKLTNGAVFTSDIEPNIENGKIERPIRPTWRFTTPLLSKQNKSFGIIVINVDASYTFSLLRSHVSDKEFIYLTAVNGDFVLSPNQQETFASSQNTTLNWDTKFTSARAPYGLTDNSISTWQNQNSAIIAARQNFKPNYASSAGSIGIFATYDIAEIYDDLLTFSASMTLALVLLGSVGSVLVYFNWLSYLRAAQARRINQQLAEQRSKDKMFESLTELSPEAMIICDVAGNIVLVNSQAEKLYSYSRHEMIGNRIDMLLPERIKTQHHQHMAGYIQAPRNRAMGDGKELFSIDAFGQEFPVEVSLSPIQLDDRMLIASSVRNISERKAIEQSLNNAIAEAKRASAAKGAFLANMSHEIRTPLNAVIGLTHLLKEQNLAPAQVSLVDKIALAGRSLLGIVNDVLDLAKIEANELTINETCCDLKTLLEELHSVFSTQAEAKGLQFILTIDESTPPYVITDAHMLRQILTNLLGNALKFTKQGHIQLKVEPVEAADLPSSQAMLRFAVIDTGIGISKAAQDKIFLPFNQEDDSTNRRFGGTGLGLSIVSNMTAILRGTLGVNSEPGIGSEFWLQLPMAVQDEPDETDLSNTDSLLIMLAEDNDDDRERLEQMSKSLGWRVEAFSDGEALVRAYDSKYQNNQPLADVLVLDWQMPTMDGITAIYKLHDQYGIENLPAILVISAYEIDNIKALDVKRVVKHYLHKPITSSDLFNAVHEVVVKHTGNTDRVIGLTKVDAIKAKWLPGVKVLVVDDSQINLEVVESILKLNGAEVTTAESGASAIEYIRNHHAQIDIVLMDVQMPIMDGLEATTHIRKALKLQALPIIALTAGTLEEERKNAIFAGMDDFLTKPIEPPKLINTIRKAVQKYRRTSIAIESLETKDAAGTNTDWPKIEGLMDNRHMFQGNQKLFTQTLRRLLNEFNWLDADNPSPMLDQESTEQRLELAGQLHKLKGIAGMIGSKRLYELASEAEVALRKTSNDVSDLISALSETMRILRVNAERYLDEDAEKAKQELHNQQDAVAFTPEQLQAFIQALQNNDMSAVITADEHKSALWTMLGNEQHQAFFNLLDDLQFKQAAQLLKDKSGL